jgi:hypothetical protein
MDAERKKPNWILVSVFVVVALLGGYVGAYCWAGSYVRDEVVFFTEYDAATGKTSLVEAPLVRRFYRQDVLLKAFQPAAWVESKLRGERVELLDGDAEPDCVLPPM